MQKKSLTIGIIVLFTMLVGCQKATVIKENVTNKTGEGYEASQKNTATETQTLIRQWMQWVCGRDISLIPYEDATGAKQYAAQPNATGTMLLAGGGSPTLVNRSITVSLAQYQNVFLPITNMFIWWNDCYPGNPENNVPTGVLSSIITEGLNGQRTLILKWDGNSILPEKIKDARGNSGFWTFPIHSSWDDGCTATSTTFYADGFWASVPLSLGTHTLEVAGDSDLRRFKDPFSNHVIYTITVTN